MMFIPADSPPEDRSWPEDLDAAKAQFMNEVVRIIAQGHGEIARLESGALELRLVTGEIFRLGEHSLMRIV
jgi:hypothetical protein